MIKPAEYAANNPDKAFPKADTCFFNLKLPNYSSPEVKNSNKYKYIMRGAYLFYFIFFQILRDKILLAINTDC